MKFSDEVTRGTIVSWMLRAPIVFALLAAGVPLPSQEVHPQGRLIKDLSLPGDVSRESVGAERKSAVEAKLSDADTALAVQGEIMGGAAAIGPDGNAYLFRNTRSPTMYVISAGGILARRIALKRPSENVIPQEESISGGRVLVVFGDEPDPKHGRGSLPQFYSLVRRLDGRALVRLQAVTGT